MKKSLVPLGTRIPWMMGDFRRSMDNLLEEFEEWDGSVQHPGYLNPVPTLITEPSWAPEIDSPWM